MSRVRLSSSFLAGYSERCVLRVRSLASCLVSVFVWAPEVRRALSQLSSDRCKKTLARVSLFSLVSCSGFFCILRFETRCTETTRGKSGGRRRIRRDERHAAKDAVRTSGFICRLMYGTLVIAVN